MSLAKCQCLVIATLNILNITTARNDDDGTPCSGYEATILQPARQTRTASYTFLFNLYPYTSYEVGTPQRLPPGGPEERGSPQRGAAPRDGVPSEKGFSQRGGPCREGVPSERGCLLRWDPHKEGLPAEVGSPQRGAAPAGGLGSGSAPRSGLYLLLPGGRRSDGRCQGSHVGGGGAEGRPVRRRFKPPEFLGFRQKEGGVLRRGSAPRMPETSGAFVRGAAVLEGEGAVQTAGSCGRFSPECA